MIREAREVHLSRKDRKVLEACCRSPVTLQRDLKRARIVLVAAAGRTTRSIAKEVGVQPLAGLIDKLRPGKERVYTKATDKRTDPRDWTSRHTADAERAVLTPCYDWSWSFSDWVLANWSFTDWILADWHLADWSCCN